MPPTPISPGRRLLLWIALALLGLWVALPHNGSPWAWWALARWRQLFTMAIAAALIAIACLMTRRNATLDPFLDRLANPSLRSRRLIACACFCFCSIYFVYTAWWQHRVFGPVTHDDCAYEVATHIAAIGRLWMPAHPCADSFDAEYLIVRPVYAAMYFPGTAILRAAAVLLHAPTWTIDIAVAAACGALVYRLAAELIDGLAALVAPLLWISSLQVRQTSLAYHSHPILVLMALTATWCWLLFRAQRHWRWIVLAGLCAGWAFITRPLDAIALLAPVCIAAAWELRRSPAVLAKAIAIAAVAALPLLSLELIANKAITGSALLSAHEFYVLRDCPGATFGFHSDRIAEPASLALEKRALYNRYMVHEIRAHTWASLWPQFWLDRFPDFLHNTLPAPLLSLFLFAGLLGLRDMRRAAVIAPIALFFALYAFYLFFTPYYPTVIWPAAVLLILLGAQQLGLALKPLGPIARIGGYLVLAAVALVSLPETDSYLHDAVESGEMAWTAHALAALPRTPALVLFRYSPTTSIAQDPVYNLDVAWPDDARVVRARYLEDLDPSIPADRRARAADCNARLIEYFAKFQPSRNVYFVQRGTHEVRYLGTVEHVRQIGLRAAAFGPNRTVLQEVPS